MKLRLQIESWKGRTKLEGYEGSKTSGFGGPPWTSV